MSRVRKTIICSVIGILILGFLYLGSRLWLTIFNGDKVLVQWQVSCLIQNPTAIVSVSADKPTLEFLDHLPQNPRITSIQEDLDHNNKVEQYGAYINGRHVEMYVNNIGFFAMYSVSKISVDGLPSLPNIYMD